MGGAAPPDSAREALGVGGLTLLSHKHLQIHFNFFNTNEPPAVRATRPGPHAKSATSPVTGHPVSRTLLSGDSARAETPINHWGFRLIHEPFVVSWAPWRNPRGREVVRTFTGRARVATGSLVIQEGAIYEGELDMAGMERAAPRPLRTRSAPPPVSIEAAAADRQSGAGSTFIRRLGSPETPWESNEADSAADGEPADAPAT